MEKKFNTSQLVPILIFIMAFTLRVLFLTIAFQGADFDRLFGSNLIFSKYIWIAQRSIQDIPLGSRILDFSPLYSCLITLLFRLFFNRFPFYILFHILLGSLSCLLIYAITYNLFNKKTAFLAAFMAIIYRPFMLYEGVLEPATLIIFLNLLSVFVLILAYKKAAPLPSSYEKMGYCVACHKKLQFAWLGSLPFIGLGAGMFIGLSFITRPNLLIFFFLACLWVFIGLKKNIKKTFNLGLSIFIGFSLIISPILIKNYQTTRKVIKPLMSSGQVFYQGNNPAARGFYGSHPYLLKEMELNPLINPEKEPDFAHELYRIFIEPEMSPGRLSYGEEKNGCQIPRHTIPSKNDSKNHTKIPYKDTEAFWFRRGMNYIKEFPLAYLKLILKKFRFFWSKYEIHDILQVYNLQWEMDRFPLLSFGLICPLALLGLFLLLKGIKRYLLLYAMILNYLISNLIFFVTSRQRLQAVPFLIPLAAFSLYQAGCIMTNLITQLKILISSPFKVPRHSQKHLLKTGCKYLFKPLGLSILLSVLFFIVHLPSVQIEHFETMLHLNHDSRKTLKEAYADLNQRKFKKARQGFQLAYSLLPFNDTRVPNRFLGGIKLKQERAIGFWKEVLRKDLQNSYARFNLGYLLFQAGKFDKAIIEFRGLLDRHVQGFYGYMLPVAQPGYYLARCYEEKKEWLKALMELEKIKKTNPGLPWVENHLRAIYEKLNMGEKAKGQQSCIERIDNPLSSSYLLAEAYYAQGEHQKVIATLQSLRFTSLRLYAPYHFLLSSSYGQLGASLDLSAPEAKKDLITKAIQETQRGLDCAPNQNISFQDIPMPYQEALSYTPGDTDLYYELGQIYLSLGEIEKARENLATALSFVPEEMPKQKKENLDRAFREADFLYQGFYN